MRKSQTAKLQLWNVCMNYNYILTNKCACEKWEKKLMALTTFHFFFEILTPQLFATPKKKGLKKIMHPFSRLAFMNIEKKNGFSVRQQKSTLPFNWCNTVLFWLQLCIFCFSFPYHLLTLLHFLLPKREFQYTFQVGTTTFFAFLSVTLYAFFLALNS